MRRILIACVTVALACVLWYMVEILRHPLMGVAAIGVSLFQTTSWAKWRVR